MGVAHADQVEQAFVVQSRQYGPVVERRGVLVVPDLQRPALRVEDGQVSPHERGQVSGEESTASRPGTLGFVGARWMAVERVAGDFLHFHTATAISFGCMAPSSRTQSVAPMLTQSCLTALSSIPHPLQRRRSSMRITDGGFFHARRIRTSSRSGEVFSV